MKKVAVVILNWNGAEMLQKYLPSVIMHTSPHLAEIIVADNGSTDNSIEILKQKFGNIRLIKLDKNYGFAEGYNRALAQCDHEYFVLLNSDVEVTKRWLEPIIEAMDIDENVAAAQPKIKSWANKHMFEYAGASGGYIDRYGYPFCRGRIISQVEQDDGQYDDQRSVMWATGACLVIRSKIYKDTGGLDGQFFAHMEEIDLCWRIKNFGYQIMVYPQSTIFHLGGGTLPNNSPRKLFLNYRNNLLLLYKNLPAEQLTKVMSTRFFLDMISAGLYLLQLKPAYTMQVFKARKAYKKLKPEYKAIRQQLQEKRRVKKHPEVYRGSILWAFFARGNKKFSQLKLLK